jgi:hypothetical protein
MSTSIRIKRALQRRDHRAINTHRLRFPSLHRTRTHQRPSAASWHKPTITLCCRHLRSATKAIGSNARYDLDRPCLPQQRPPVARSRAPTASSKRGSYPLSLLSDYLWRPLGRWSASIEPARPRAWIRCVPCVRLGAFRPGKHAPVGPAMLFLPPPDRTVGPPPCSRRWLSGKPQRDATAAELPSSFSLCVLRRFGLVYLGGRERDEPLMLQQLALCPIGCNCLECRCRTAGGPRSGAPVIRCWFTGPAAID